MVGGAHENLFYNLTNFHGKKQEAALVGW